MISLGRYLNRRFDKLERLIMASAAAIAREIDGETNRISALLTSVRNELREATRNVDATVQAKVEEQLALLDPAIAGLKGIGADAENPVPAPVPVQDQPSPGSSFPQV